MTIKTVIFDCDGVLVDSEIINCRIEAEYKTELGFPTTTEEMVTKFAGLNAKDPSVLAEFKRLPANYETLVDQRILKAYDSELRAISGVEATLRKIQVPFCIASSSHPDWLKLKLRLTGLTGYFGDAVFSSHDVNVKRGKPAPDLFFYAAERMTWSPNDCLVVEDSVPGVLAGKAAGMKVCGFVGGGHIFPGHVQRLIAAGADEVVADFSEILKFIS